MANGDQVGSLTVLLLAPIYCFLCIAVALTIAVVVVVAPATVVAVVVIAMPEFLPILILELRK